MLSKIVAVLISFNLASALQASDDAVINGSYDTPTNRKVNNPVSRTTP